MYICPLISTHHRRCGWRACRSSPARWRPSVPHGSCSEWHPGRPASPSLWRCRTYATASYPAPCCPGRRWCRPGRRLCATSSGTAWWPPRSWSPRPRGRRPRVDRRRRLPLPPRHTCGPPTGTASRSRRRSWPFGLACGESCGCRGVAAVPACSTERKRNGDTKGKANRILRLRRAC